MRNKLYFFFFGSFYLSAQEIWLISAKPSPELFDSVSFFSKWRKRKIVFISQEKLRESYPKLALLPHNEGQVPYLLFYQKRLLKFGFLDKSKSLVDLENELFQEMATYLAQRQKPQEFYAWHYAYLAYLTQNKKEALFWLTHLRKQKLSGQDRKALLVLQSLFYN
ncbi:MAG: hypothetical protein NZM25_04955 [Leptospiraceae bacterium]|nr:hypothetical protein [Leptospiraceae bacterium]